MRSAPPYPRNARPGGRPSGGSPACVKVCTHSGRGLFPAPLPLSARLRGEREGPAPKGVGGARWVVPLLGACGSPTSPRPSPPQGRRRGYLGSGISVHTPARLRGRKWKGQQAAVILAWRAAATDPVCDRSDPTAPSRSAAGRLDPARGAWDWGSRAGGRAGSRNIPSRSVRARRARETAMDQDQVVEIPGFLSRKTGENRRAKTDRRPHAASAGLRSKRAQQMSSRCVHVKGGLYT